jgi:hypothetical protein
MATPGPMDSGKYRMVEIALSCLHVIPVFWAVQVSKYCSGGFSASILACWKEFRDIGNAREITVPALRAAKPVTKSRRVVRNFMPPQRYSRHTGSRLRGSPPFFCNEVLLSSILAFRTQFRHFRNYSILFERSMPSFPFGYDWGILGTLASPGIHSTPIPTSDADGTSCRAQRTLSGT